MTEVFLFFWVLSGLLILLERRIIIIVIYLGIFSLVTSLCFLLFAAPDVAMAEAAISTFSTIFFIVAFEKYYGLGAEAGLSSTARENPQEKKPSLRIKKHILPLSFTVLLFLLFIYFLPSGNVNPYLRDQYLAMFTRDIGGENAVTAIYLGYRMYDTLFEALMLLVSVVAVVHLSHYKDVTVSDGVRSDINRSVIGSITIRAICPLILVFGIYLITNGHITPGGGFQGGVALAAFFVCRYFIYDIYDTQAGRIILMEKTVFAAIILIPIFFIFFGAYQVFPQWRHVYLIAMNSLIGMKVACGFIVIFYRYIAFEKR
ncbi:MAG: DUF4040 domain-containing protein [Treponema sp.]|nr:DUF4040 domain-containing protein [Treponema sp.]